MIIDITHTEQKKWQKLIEKDPVKFFDDIAPNALLESRKAIASFVGCHHDDIAFVENATSGVNTILRSLDFNENDEILSQIENLKISDSNASQHEQKEKEKEISTQKDTKINLKELLQPKSIDDSHQKQLDWIQKQIDQTKNELICINIEYINV